MFDKVLKFGGSSVASYKEIATVAGIIKKASKEKRIVVVVSAMKGVTDALEECAEKAEKGDEDYLEIIEMLEIKHLDTIRNLIAVKNQSGVITQIKIWLNQLEDVCRGVYLIREVSPKTMDYIYCFGELLSAFILTHTLNHWEVDAVFRDSRVLIKTDRSFGAAHVDFKATSSLLNRELELSHSQKINVFPGFIGSTQNNETTTLGRGGSDYTASLLAGLLNAEVLELWTDVEGVFTADPRKVPDARPVRQLSYEEAMELAHFGAKVIYPPTMQPVLEREIPILIKNTFKPDAAGTLITKQPENDGGTVRGLTEMDGVALLTLSGSSMVGVPGIAARLFKALAEHNVNIILITQASSEHTITVGIREKDTDRAKEVVTSEFGNEITLHQINEPEIDRELSIISLVGDGMKRHPGIAGKMFGTLGEHDINIIAIAQGSSERNISLVVRTQDGEKAIRALHGAFFN